MKLLVTGANGQVGWELVRSLMPLGEVIATDRAQCDLSRPETMSSFIRDVRPDVIVNAAAYTAVDKAEQEEEPLRHHIHIGRFKTASMIISLRNKLVAEAFYLTNNIEKYGSGFIRIRKALCDYPEIQFEIKEFAGGVMVMFVRHGGVSGGVSGGVNALLAYIQSNPGQRAGEIATALNLSRRTIEHWLKQLKDDQLIEYRGVPKTGGYYPKNQ